MYFIPPTVHGLRPIDVEFITKLGERVNVIPIIAKSDALNTMELTAFKAKIVEDLKKYDLTIFDFQNANSSDDLTKYVFAVMGSTTPERTREYPWGVVHIEDENVCDYKRLRQLLIRTHMLSLLNYTNEVLYEDFRKINMSSQCTKDGKKSCV